MIQLLLAEDWDVQSIAVCTEHHVNKECKSVNGIDQGSDHMRHPQKRWLGLIARVRARLHDCIIQHPPMK